MRSLLKAVEKFLIQCKTAVVDFLMSGKKQEEKSVTEGQWVWKAFIQRVK